MKRKTLAISIVGIMCLVAAAPSLLADEVDQEQTDTRNYFGFGNGGKFAQSFIPTVNTLTRVQLFCKPKADCDDIGFVKLSIRSELDGSDLTSKTITAPQMPETYYWIEFDFEDISVTPGQTYYIIVEVDDTGYSTGFLFKTGPSSNPYPYGRMYMKTNEWFNVYDGQDLSFKTFGEEGNPYPYTPSEPSPSLYESDVSVKPMLSWSGGDPEGDNVFYDVYLEKDDSSPDILVSNDQTVTYFNPDFILDKDSTYYWKVVATDEHGKTKNGPVWSFDTQTEPHYSDMKVAASGGLGLKTQVTNKGTDPVSDVSYDINVKGGLFNKINVTVNGTIDSLDPDKSFTISKPGFMQLFGIGKVDISIVVTSGVDVYTVDKNGFVLFGLLIVKK